MNKTRVYAIKDNIIYFDSNVKLYSDHEQDCCEQHELDMKDLTLEEFEGLIFDLTNDNFFERVKDYGIRLKPLNGHPVPIPGYGVNNGYYSSDLSLVVKSNNSEFRKEYKIDECQIIDWE